MKKGTTKIIYGAIAILIFLYWTNRDEIYPEQQKDFETNFQNNSLNINTKIVIHDEDNKEEARCGIIKEVSDVNDSTINVNFEFMYKKEIYNMNNHVHSILKEYYVLGDTNRVYIYNENPNNCRVKPMVAKWCVEL